MRTRILSIRNCGRGGHEREVVVASPNCTVRCKPTDLESAELFAKTLFRNQGRKPFGPAWGEIAESYGGHLTRGTADKLFQRLVDQAERI